MIDNLEDMLDDFAGDPSRIRCFLHIVNLVAKSLLKQFDVPKKKNDGDNEGGALDDLLRQLAEGIEEEEQTTLAESASDEDEDEDDVNDWVDELQSLDAGEREMAAVQIWPIRFVIVKVRDTPEMLPQLMTAYQIRKLAFKIIHSTTIILPAWHQVLEELKLASRLLPRDVSTRWNSTFDMLNLALEYRAAVDKITANRKLDLRGVGDHETTPRHAKGVPSALYEPHSPLTVP
jgi:hypothetical protein